MFTILGKLAERWLGDENGELHGRFLRGLAGMDSARPAYDLWELARSANTSPGLREAIAKGDVAAFGPSEGNDDAAAFRLKLDAFLHEHGHHSVQEMEVGARTWDEDLPTVLAMVRNYLDAEADRSPAAIEE